MNATIAGTGSCLGDTEYSNIGLRESDLMIGGLNVGELVRESFDMEHWRGKLEADEKDLSDAEVFDTAVRQLTGIEKRRFSSKKGAEELGAEAATRALDAAGIKASDLDYIIVGTFTPEREIPNPALTLANLIGAPKKAAVTHNETCSGFIIGMDLAYGKLQTGDCETILVGSTERLTKFTNFRDYKTAYLFGDGAGAVVLKADENGGIVCPAYVGSDYSGKHIIKRNSELIEMGGGPDVLKRAVRAMVESAHIALLYYNLGKSVDGNYKKIRDDFDTLKDVYPLDSFLDDIDWVIPHQASGRITERLAITMGYGDLSKFGNTIVEEGNISGGSIPRTLDRLIREGKLERGQRVLLTSVGGGYTLGGLVFVY